MAGVSGAEGFPATVRVILPVTSRFGSFVASPIRYDTTSVPKKVPPVVTFTCVPPAAEAIPVPEATCTSNRRSCFEGNGLKAGAITSNV